MSVAAWACYLPDVHPCFVDMAQTLDRTVARLERRLGSLHAEVVQLEAALGAECSTPDKRVQQTRLAAYREEIADYQATIALCRSQFEAQLVRRWTHAEIAHAKTEPAQARGSEQAPGVEQPQPAVASRDHAVPMARPSSWPL